MKVGDRVKSLGSSLVSGLSFSGSGHARPPPSSAANTTAAVTNGGPDHDGRDEMLERLRSEAAAVVRKEPILSMLLSRVGLLDAATLARLGGNPSRVAQAAALTCASPEPAKSFEEAIARIVSHRLSSCSGTSENICPKFLRQLLEESFRNTAELEMGHTMSEAVREDAVAIVRRDPACETLLEAVLFMKGFHSLVIHRAARRAWKPAEASTVEEGAVPNGNDMEQTVSNREGASVAGERFVALLLQSQASAAFGVDIHPACSIGAGVMIDHA